MINRLLLLVSAFMILTISVKANSSFPILGGDDEPSTVFFDLNSCLSNAGVPNSANDYSEFTAEISNTSDCANLSVIGDNLYRDNPETNTHSCAPGVDNSIAMCVGISDNCDYVAGDSKAIKFSIEVDPIDNMPATLSQLRFYENSPETFQWINGPNGPNNYPTLYAIRVLVNGVVVYEESDIPTEQEWNEEVYNFSSIESFIVTETTIFDFELLPYCPVGNGAMVAAWDIDDIQLIAGCDPVEGGEIGTDEGDELFICAGDGIDDFIDVSLNNNIGTNSQWVITDSDGLILGLPESPPFNLEGAGAGTCLIWHLSYANGITGLNMGDNANNLVGCFDFSNPITVNREGVNGGQLAIEGGETTIEICVGDGIADPIEVTLAGNAGQNMAWVITDSDGNILGLPDAPPFNLEGAGAGTCLIWNLSFADGLLGAEVGMNAAELQGCYDLSNPITVTRNEATGGILTFEDGTASANICAGDGNPDPLNVILDGNSGDNMAWVITDSDGNILDLPDAPPFDLDGAGAGICLIWNLSFADGLTGAEVGMNANDLAGCFSLSNPIEVIREEANGGTISFDGSTESTVNICAGDGIPDPLDVILTGNVGSNSSWIITSSNGTILGLPDAPPFDLEGAGAGTCLIWHISYADGLLGLEIDLNASELVGCFDLSNALTVEREEAAGGILTFEDETEVVDICVGDGIDDPLNVILTGNSVSNNAWVITDPDGNILDLPMSPPFNLEGAGAGTCLIWNISFSDNTTGLEIGMNANEIEGCFSLSNPLTVNRTEVDGGILATTEGETQLTICADDGMSDAFDVTLSGIIGTNTAWVLTDINGIILGLPDAPPFDLEGAGQGVCLLWNLSYEEGLIGLEMGLNANNLEGCSDLSNPISITRLVGDNCDLVLCEAEGGELMLSDSSTAVTICVGDGIPDPLEVILEGNQGTNSSYIITNSDGEILGLPAGPPFDLEGAGEGVCLIWHIASEANLSGDIVGNNLTDLAGCYDLSNPIIVTRVSGEDCDNLGCDVEGGALTFMDGTTQVTICAGDGIPDPLDIILTGASGTISGWLITAIDGTILGLPDSPPFDLDDAGDGICLIWHISYEDGIIGLEMNLNSNDLEGCFDLSNPVAVTRVSGPACDNIDCSVDGGNLATLDGLTEIEICADDGIPDAFDVSLENNFGGISGWIITDVSGNIIGIPDMPPFDLEGAGTGVCLLWHISYEEGLLGYELDSNITQLDGCFDLSNQITVTRYEGENCQMIGCEAEGGVITYNDSLNQVTICAGDGIDDFIDVELSGNSGSNSQWVITDNSLTILDLPAGDPPFNFEGAEAGICQIWHLSYEDGIVGLEIGANAGDIMGCFSLSNSILVIREGVDGGELTFEGDSTTIDICVGDGEIDSLYTNLINQVGESSQWIITDSDGMILDLPVAPPFILEEAVEGTCLIWNISYNGSIMGLEAGQNAADLAGCYDLSNPITVIRNEGDNCMDGLVDSENEFVLSLSPNPVSDELVIYFERLIHSEGTAVIYNSQGKRIESITGKEGEKVIVNVASYLNGIYYVRVGLRGHQTVKKFLKIQ